MPDADLHYPHLGEPEGLGWRAARLWRRRNTYVLRQGERIDAEVAADNPECFTPKEWGSHIASLTAGGWRYGEVILDAGARPPSSPFLVQHETRDERQGRQARSARSAACEDCLLFYQLEMRRLGRCHPPQFALTPVNRLMESEHKPLEEGYVAAPGHGTGRSDVPRKEALHDGEVR